MPVYGLRPDDVVVDSSGNVQTGVTITLHANQSDAQAGANALASTTTNAGRWQATVSQSPVWVRTPNGSVYEIEDVTGTVDAHLGGDATNLVPTVSALQSNVSSMQAAWTSYTPTLTGFTLGDGTVAAAYASFGKTVHVRFRFVAGASSTFTAGATLLVSLPVAPNAAYASEQVLGSVTLFDNSAGLSSRTAGVVAYASGSNVFFVAAKDTSATVTQSAPWAWAASDKLMFTATYEAA